MFRGSYGQALGRLCCASFVTLALGCGPAAPKIGTVPVNGTVTYKGAAVADATVAFVPKDASTGKQAVGTTDAQGRFTLKTLVGGTTSADGAMPGDYKVTVVKVSGGGPSSGSMPTLGGGGGPSATTLGDPNQKAASADTSGLQLPLKYSDSAKSDLSATVKASGNEPVALTLTDE